MKINVKNIVIAVLAVAVVLLAALGVVLMIELDKSNFDNIEVERKYLVDINNLPDGISGADVLVMEQTYISFSPEMRVRKINDLYYFFTMKLPQDNIGLAREETEFAVSKDEYDELVKKQVGNTIYKTRYQFFENGIKVEVDIYSAELEGLAVVEVEFANTKKSNSFTPPKWFGKEVTSDLRYKNANLARNGMPTE